MAAVGDDKETVGSTAPMLWDKKTQVGGRRAERSRRNGVNAHSTWSLAGMRFAGWGRRGEGRAGWRAVLPFVAASCRCRQVVQVGLATALA